MQDQGCSTYLHSNTHPFHSLHTFYVFNIREFKRTPSLCTHELETLNVKVIHRNRQEGATAIVRVIGHFS